VILILLRADHLYQLKNQLSGRNVTSVVDGREVLAQWSSLVEFAKAYGHQLDPLALIHLGPNVDACLIRRQP
jgi:hypothetical protein